MARVSSARLSVSAMTAFVTALRSLRPGFLLLTPACILLGFGIALHEGASVSAAAFTLVLLGSVAAHASVNAFNEFFDFRSGLDSRTERTPFSGGSGALIDAPNAEFVVLATAVGMLAVATGVGIYLITLYGLTLLPVALAGLILILTYTQWLTAWPIAGMFAPGIGFGLLMVLGAVYVFTGGVSPAALVAALVPFLLVSNLQLLNQFPDYDADRSVGRQTFVIAYGTGAGASMYGVLLTLAIAALLFSVIVQLLPILTLVALVPMTAGIVAWRGLLQHGEDIGKLLPYMAANVIAAIGTPAVMGIELVLS